MNKVSKKQSKKEDWEKTCGLESHFPTRAPLLLSEVQCSVVLHIISRFALSDWGIEMANRDLRDKIIVSQIKRLKNVIREGD